jgi:hypothetical protein
MDNIRHIIRKQKVLVELNGTESDGLALQGRLTVLCEQMTPLLERVLDSCGDGESHVYVDHIEIDAGTMTMESLESELPEAVSGELDKFLRGHIPLRKSLLPFVSDNIRQTTAQGSIHEAFIYFLKTGSLPWSFHIPVGKTLEGVVSASWREAEKARVGPISDKGSLLQCLSDATARKRLVRQFTPGFLGNLTSFLSPEVNTVVVKILPPLLRADIPSTIKEGLIRQIWEAVFAKIAARRTLTAADLARIVRDILPAAVKDAVSPDSIEYIATQTSPERNTGTGESIGKGSAAEYVPEIDTFSSSHEDRHGSGKDIDKALEVENPLEYKKSALSYDSRHGRGEGIDKGAATEKLPDIEESSSSHDDRPGSVEHPDARHGIYIGNAGLVLLHHFLPQFFGALEIALENKLVQPDRALCLLHFLATGQVVTPEYELVLPKILCGIPVLAPVETGLELTGPEKEEAVALLEAVIRHWDALRNTSIDGLRGAFLLRQGKVSLREDGEWLLQVEPKSVDILVEKLPWGFSMIQLPWMETLLHVEWR